MLTFIFLALTVAGCSDDKTPQKQAGAVKNSTERAKEAIEEYGKRPIDKAKKTQSLGEDRTRGIDEAMGNMDKR